MILGEKVSLRAIESSDLHVYHAWINDADTNRLRGLHHPISLEDCQKFLDERRTASASQMTFVIESKDSTPIGLVGLRGICARSRRAEIWIYIGEKSEWRKGYGSDAMRALIKYAFRDMNLHRVWLEMDPGYPGTVEMYRKLGFIHEGTLRKDHYRHGEYRDAAIFGLLRDEWRD